MSTRVNLFTSGLENWGITVNLITMYAYYSMDMLIEALGYFKWGERTSITRLLTLGRVHFPLIFITTLFVSSLHLWAFLPIVSISLNGISKGSTPSIEPCLNGWVTLRRLSQNLQVKVYAIMVRVESRLLLLFNGCHRTSSRKSLSISSWVIPI